MTERLQRFLYAIDAGIFGAAFVVSLLLTALASPLLTAADIPWRTCAFLVPSVVIIKLVAFHLARVYRVYWAYAGFRDAVKLCIGAGGSSAVLLAVMLSTPLLAGMPITLLLFDLVLTLGATAGLRFFERALREFRPGSGRGKRAIIVGAGEAGQLVGRELRQNPDSEVIPVCYLDDDPEKLGRRIHDIPVVGRLDDLPAAIRRHRVGEVIVAIASAPRKVVTEVVEKARAAGVDFKIVPRLSDVISGATRVSEVKEIRVADLLGRNSGSPDLELLRAYYAGKTVMVTGAGGSIGSELCRQLAFLGLGKLVLFERNESNLYHLAQLLEEMKTPAPAVPVLGDICDRPCLDRAFAAHRPQVVLHAAAYKHVPLLEDNAAEAVKNNLLGTKTLAAAAMQTGVDRFVLVSTDKAVRPSSVMGCTKRAAEFICQEAALGSATEFVTVRFGNVLDSDGSVVPLFRRQIERGGPVTVTHPEVTRYFMSIPEAAGLVLTAAAIGRPSSVYVLEMGSPIRIDDLAREMIQLAGLVPGRDIEIAYTGLRPGEKLHEELWYTHEELTSTAHPGILAALSENGPPEELGARIDELQYITSNGAAAADLTRVLGEIVPGFRPGAQARPEVAPERRQTVEKPRRPISVP